MALGDFTPLIDRSAANYGLPQDLWREVIRTESSGNPYAVGTSGEKGLAQLMPLIYGKSDQLGDAIDPFNPEQNLDRGASLLSKLYKQYGNWRDALAGYNAGGNLSAGFPYADKILYKLGGFNEWVKNPFNMVPGVGSTQVARDNSGSPIFTAIVKRIFGDEVAGLLRGGMWSFVLILTAALLGFLAVKRMI